MSQFRETGFQLDPKKRPATAKRGGQEVLADPIATLLQPCEACGRKTGVEDLDPELLARLLAAVSAGAASRTGSGASPIPRGYNSMVAGAKAQLKDALRREVEGVYPAEVPALLRNNALNLCYPPFASQFACCLLNADLEVWKALKTVYRQARSAPRRDREFQAFRVWNAKQAGKSNSEIARDEKLTERTVRERLTWLRRRSGLRERHRTKKKNSPR